MSVDMQIDNGIPLTAGKGAAFRMRSEQEILMDLASILIDIRTLLERSLSTDRTGSVSSISFEDMTKGDPKVTSKGYVGSPLTIEDVDAALVVHAYAHRRAAELAMNGWQETVDMLQGKEP